ncbi:MAG: UDP-N-acetylmuramoyl-L-alanyl-D-glutamate--2,6-diaminopimelate ligase [Candidatus Hydrogenedentes bacterium]|nr:UDP-N-acetylmuramoyl-L-alanyl-D-glutamate--2,6-diaminopimelate ligase [Candidatus Hydrogenedentota bacterium]
MVTRVTEDSRKCEPGSIFVAAPGAHVDGHDFVSFAVSAGAIAVIGERNGIAQSAGVPYLSVKNARKALGILAHALHGNPSQEMSVVGITGTNGKTTSARMVQYILRTAGHPCAFFGTIGYEIAGTMHEAKHTTPFGEELADIFALTHGVGETHVAMEVSSHALEQERVAGIRFRVGAFTNLTQDHLDYHKDMESYKRAKLMLFERIEGNDAFTAVNKEDTSAKDFVAASRVKCYSYGPGGDVRAERANTTARETTFAIKSPWGNASVKMRMLGKHNVANALCAATICGGLGAPVETIAQALSTLQNVPGRFEHVDAGQNFQVIVDYAHTDDGLRNVLNAARGICEGRLIVVFGCGGDRDKTKRPKMGGVAAKLADFAIVTSDNPRSEDPERILLDIEVGLQHAGTQKYDDYEMILDRTEAIRRAIGMAKAGDVIMIAGKGHEDYQILGNKRIHFDDREVARAILTEGKR